MRTTTKRELRRFGSLLLLGAGGLMAGQSAAAAELRSEATGAGQPDFDRRAIAAMCAEATAAAKALDLEEALPITPKTIVDYSIAPPELSKMLGSVGTVSSSNYLYAISRAAKLCYIERLRRGRLNKALSELSTNNVGASERPWAYAVATQYLTKLSVDVDALNRASRPRVERDAPNTNAPGVWIVWWPRPKAGSGALASVRFIGKGKPLFDVRVEDADYLRRDPISTK